jgi:hypothetical protein
MAVSPYSVGLQIEAVKHVPLDSASRFQVRWFLNDGLKGASDVFPRVGDEVSFGFNSRFTVEARGVITQLLQLSLVELPASGQPPTLAGVLMIDLNAHVPKPPKTVSRQRATLAMARCPYDPPVLIRVSLECSPADAVGPPSAGRGASASPQMSTASPVPRAPGAQTSSASQPRGGSAAPCGGGQQQPQQGISPEISRMEQERTAAVVSSLSSANDQLRDENLLLRRAIENARREPDAPAAVTQLESIARSIDESRYREDADADADAAEEAGGVSDGRESSAGRRGQRTLREQLDEAQVENATLKKGLGAAKESLRQMIDKERELRQQANNATRAKTFLESELEKLQRELDTERQRGRSAAQDAESEMGGELATTREMLASSQQMARDLRAMVHSADTLADSLKRELAAAKKDAAEASARAQDATRIAEQRAQEAEARAARAADAVETGQLELNKLHRYCVDVSNRLKAATEALASERTTARNLSRQLEDLKSVAAAQNKFAAHVTNSRTAADGSGLITGRSSSRLTSVYTPDYRGTSMSQQHHPGRSASLPPTGHGDANMSL